MSKAWSGPRHRPRVLFLNNQGLISIGGGVTILRHLVHDLAPDFDVTVLSNDPPAPGFAGVNQLTVPLARPRSWRLAPLERASHLADAVPQPEIAAADVVVALDCHFNLALRRTKPRRLVYLSLSCIPRQEWFAAPGISSIPFYAQYAYLERGIASAAAVVIVSSTSHGAELRRYEGMPGLRPVVLHPVFRWQERSSPQTKSRPLTILSAGRLAAVKNYQAVIELAKRLADLDCRFIIAGDGSEEHRLRAQSAAAADSDRITFIGPVADMDSLLASADLFLHPSRYESFGIAIFEAMQAGVPPVCSSRSVCGIREFLTDGVNASLVDFDDPDRAASVLRELIVDPKRRERLGAAARATAEEILKRDYTREFRKILSTVGLDAAHAN